MSLLMLSIIVAVALVSAYIGFRMGVRAGAAFYHAFLTQQIAEYQAAVEEYERQVAERAGNQ